MKQIGGRSEDRRQHGGQLCWNTLQVIDLSSIIDCVKVCNPVSIVLQAGWKAVSSWMP